MKIRSGGHKQMQPVRKPLKKSGLLFCRHAVVNLKAIQPQSGKLRNNCFKGGQIIADAGGMSQHSHPPGPPDDGNCFRHIPVFFGTLQGTR